VTEPESSATTTILPLFPLQTVLLPGVQPAAAHLRAALPQLIADLVTGTVPAANSAWWPCGRR